MQWGYTNLEQQREGLVPYKERFRLFQDALSPGILIS